MLKSTRQFVVERGENCQVVTSSLNNDASVETAWQEKRQVYLVVHSIKGCKLTMTRWGLSHVTVDMYFSSNSLKPTPSSACITFWWPPSLEVEE